LVDKISERNSQLSKEYEITEEMKEKALKISYSLDENQLEKLVILSFQRSIIFEEEEDSGVINIKSSKGLNTNKDIILIDSKSENQNKDNNLVSANSYDFNSQINSDKNEATKEDKTKISSELEKKLNKNSENNQNFGNYLLSKLIKNKKNSYFHINKELIYTKLEKNTNLITQLNSNNLNTLLSNNNNNYTNLHLKSQFSFKNYASIPQILYQNQKSYNNDSLYNLFNSDCFNMHLIMFYLSTKDESTIIDVLVNIIYSKFINQSLFYIPQLCFLISNKKFYEAIENYVLDICVDQIKFSLISHWLLNSFIEHDDMQVVKKFDKFMQRVEMTLVNGRRATISNYRMFNSLNKKSDEDVVLNSLDKEFKLEYFDKTSKFYHDMKSMCEKLKKYPKEDKINPNLTRIGKLNSYLNRFNKKIRDLFQTVIRQKNMHYNSINPNAIQTGSNSNNNILNNNNNVKDGQILLDEKIMNYKFSSKSLTLFRGFILPFDDNVSTVDEYNTLIVNFVPEHSFCFSTKARVPVKLTVETIKVFEAEFWDDLIIKDEEKLLENEIKELDDRKSINTRITQINEGKKLL